MDYTSSKFAKNKSSYKRHKVCNIILCTKYIHKYKYAEIVIKHQEYDMYMDIDYKSILINF